jgi:hypothetical protein
LFLSLESELLYDWPLAANQFILATSPLRRLTTSIFFFQLNTCGHNPYVTSSLVRGWFCRLQLLLALASAVTVRSESHYCLRFETPPTWRATSPYLYPPGTGWAGYTPRHWVSFFVASYDSQGYGGDIRPLLHRKHGTSPLQRPTG